MASTRNETGMNELIVENDFTNRFLLQESLRSCGWPHSIAVSGKEAVEAARDDTRGSIRDQCASLLVRCVEKARFLTGPVSPGLVAR